MSKQKTEHEVIADERIIEMFFQRDEKAIGETDRKYGNFLFRTAYNILHDRSDCEECKNDTYLDAWNAIPPARPNVLPAFLTQIMRRTALDRYKERSSAKRIPSEMTVCVEELADSVCGKDTVESEFDAREVGRKISEYVRSLPERQRFIFIERYYMAEGTAYIAGELNISVPTVYRELEKIRAGLKSHLERNDIYL